MNDELALPERYVQILRLWALGYEDAEIGRELFLAESTAKWHARRILEQLGARNRQNAVALAVYEGHLVIDDRDGFMEVTCVMEREEEAA